MIPIKIGEEKYTIKTISELTTAEFIELGKIENPDILKYVAWQTGVENENAFFAVISPTVEKAIGQIPDITKLKFSKQFDKNKIIDTVGQRHQIEGCNLTGYELLVYCLAVSQARSHNVKDIIKLYDQYLQMPFYEVLPSGFFFFKSYSNGKRKEAKLSSWLLGLTKTKS